MSETFLKWTEKNIQTKQTRNFQEFYFYNISSKKLVHYLLSRCSKFNSEKGLCLLKISCEYAITTTKCIVYVCQLMYNALYFVQNISDMYFKLTSNLSTYVKLTPKSIAHIFEAFNARKKHKNV